MKFGWKDFFYFQQSEKRAIILLLVLIVLCLGTTFFYNSFLEKEEIRQQEELTAEFVTFQNSLTSKQITSEDTIVRIKPQQTTTSPSRKLAKGETIELNGADIAQVKRIPGIGDMYASRIVDYHNRLGGFTSAEQLIEVEGISANRLKNIIPYIQLNRKPKQLRINRLSIEQLSKHPYINITQAQAVVEMRLNGTIKTIDNLRQNQEFAPRDIDRLSGYISFD